MINNYKHEEELADHPKIFHKFPTIISYIPSFSQ